MSRIIMRKNVDRNNGRQPSKPLLCREGLYRGYEIRHSLKELVWAWSIPLARIADDPWINLSGKTSKNPMLARTQVVRESNQKTTFQNCEFLRLDLRNKTTGSDKLFGLCAKRNIRWRDSWFKVMHWILNPRILRRLQCWDMDC